MRFYLPSGLLSLVLVPTFAFGAAAVNHDPLNHENDQFWGRFLEDASFSMPPPKVDCLVDVTIACFSEDGTPCSEIEPPVGTCAIGPTINDVAFVYKPSECDPTANDQGDQTYCEDSEALTDGPITVFCKDNDDGSDMVVEPSDAIEAGDSFTVAAAGGGALPEKIDCIYRDEAGTKIQQVIIDTSGSVTLNLLNTFGSFTLASCAPAGEVYSCLEDLNYKINLYVPALCCQFGTKTCYTVLTFLFGVPCVTQFKHWHS